MRDIDKDGKLEIDEAKQYIENWCQKELAIEDANNLVKEIFEQMDANHEKHVTLMEIFEYMKKAKEMAEKQ